MNFKKIADTSFKSEAFLIEAIMLLPCSIKDYLQIAF